MRTLVPVFATAVLCAACQPTSVAREPFSEIRCALVNLPQLMQSPTVAFVGETSRALHAWRSSAGEPIVDRTARACDEAPLDSILVISWNTHLGHADVRAFVADLRAGRVLPGRRINHFVLLVQEAYRDGDDVPETVSGEGCARRMGGVGPDIADIADSLGLALFYVPSMRNGCGRTPRQDRGNAILSTLPLSNLRAIELPLLRQRRVAAMAEVSGKTTEGRDWHLVVASVHLENRSAGGPRSWMQGRARQAETLVAQLPDSVLLAVGGDLNAISGADEPAVRIIGSKFAHSPEHQKKQTFVSYFVMRSQLDYLFFRCYGAHRSTYWRANQRYGSDHYPIMGFVRVR
ncbi:MAG TPA: endonuclease/exonuclease/phosphatase family protein [Longimicrobiales bacterium]